MLEIELSIFLIYVTHAGAPDTKRTKIDISTRARTCAQEYKKFLHRSSKQKIKTKLKFVPHGARRASTDKF